MADVVFRTRVTVDSSQFIREFRQLENRYSTFDVRLDIEGFESGRAVKEIKTLERQVVKSFANIRQEVGKAVRSFVALERSIRGSRDNLTRLNRSFQNISKSSRLVANNIDRAEDQLRQFASARNLVALDALDQRFDNLTNSLRFTRIQTDRADNSMRRFRQNSLGRFTSAALFGTASAVLAAGFAVRAVASVVGEIAKLNAEFDLLARRTAAIAGATTQQAEELRTAALTLGETTIFTAREAAAAQAELAKAGFDTAENLTALPGVLDLAAAGQVELTTATLIMARTLRGFSLEAEEAARVTDVLAKTAVSSAIGVTDIGEAIKFVAPLAVQTGIALEEVAAAVGLLGDAGFVGGIAGRGLRRALVNLVAPSERAKDAMRALGIQIDTTDLSLEGIIGQLEEAGATTADVVQIFGVRAGPQMAALLNVGSEAIREYTEDLEDAGGTAERIADEQLGGLQGAIIRLQSAFETLRIRFVSDIGLDNVLTAFIDALRFNLPSIENALARIFDPIRDFLALVEFQLGPALSNLGNSITNDFVQVLEDGFNFLLENGDDVLAFVQGFITTLTDALSLLLDVASTISNLLPSGLAQVLGALLALKVGVGIVAGLAKGFAALSASAATAAGSFGLLSGVIGSFGLGPLAVAAAGVAGAFIGISKAIEAIRRPSIIAEDVTRALNDAFADAVAATGDYDEALQELIDTKEELILLELSDDLQDDIDKLNAFFEAVAIFGGPALDPLTIEDILGNPESLQEYSDLLAQIEDGILNIQVGAVEGLSGDAAGAFAADFVEGVASGRDSIEEIQKLVGASNTAANDVVAAAEILAAAYGDAGNIITEGAVGGLESVDRFEQAFIERLQLGIVSPSAESLLLETLAEQAADLGAATRGAITEGLVEAYSEPLNLDLFTPTTIDDIIAATFDLDAEDLNLSDVREAFQTGVLDVLDQFDTVFASELQQRADQITNLDEFNEFVVAVTPFASETSRQLAGAAARDGINTFVATYAEAVRGGLIQPIDEIVLQEILALGSTEQGAVLTQQLTDILAVNPQLFEELTDQYQSSLNDLFTFTVDEEGELQTGILGLFPDDLLVGQFGDIGFNALQELEDVIDAFDPATIPALEVPIDEEKFRSTTGFLIPEIQEIRDEALTADLAADQAISAAEDAITAYANTNAVSEGLRVNVTETSELVATTAEGIVVELGEAGTAGGEDLTSNILDELQRFADIELPNLINDINRQLVFTVDVDVNANTSGTGALVRHEGGYIFGPRGGDVPVIAQQGEFMLQRRAVQALTNSGIDVNALNQAHRQPVNNSYARTFNSEVHIHTNTRYPETHGAKASKEIELLARRNL